MGAQRNSFSNWLDSRYTGPRDSAIEAQLLTLAEAFDRAEETGSLAFADLQMVVEGASSPRGMLWNNATGLLEKLSARWREAAEAVLAMSKSRKANVRFSALCALGKHTPADITDTMLAAGLADKSSRVRWKAAQRTEDLKRRHLLCDLEKAVQLEPNAKARAEIEHAFLMLRDGFILKAGSDGGYNLWVRTPRGSTGVSVSAEDLKIKGIDSIVAQVRKDS